MTNTDIAAVFEQIADLLEFQGANTFRVRAYRSAGRTVRALEEPVADIAADPERKLTAIDGIGKDLAEKIAVLLDTGTLPMLDELLEKVPRTVLAVMRVPGLGPKRAAVLHRELGVSSLDDLRRACEDRRVRELPGFGAKTEQKILDGLEIAAEADQRMLWVTADDIVASLTDHLSQCPAVERLEAAGSYRRRCETVGDIDLLAIASGEGAGDVDAVMDCLGAYPDVAETLLRGETKMSVRLRDGIQVDLRVLAEESFGAALVYFTGSKEHNVVLRGRAKKQGLKVSEYGVFRDQEQIAGRAEEDVYAAVGLPWFPPELREARREFEWADADALPRLIELSDIRGDLHMHTTWSDGVASIRTMALTARDRGYEYIAITDHSQRVSVAGGLDADRLRRQWEEVDQIDQELSDIQVLKGVEVDILERGGLDLPDDVLAGADWVVASVHFGQKQSEAEITRRIVDALANPNVSAIAHPTGRMLLQREPYRVDLDAVMSAARDHGKLLELNASPNRLDLSDIACAQAKAMGVPIVISTDSHRPERLPAMRLGINQARRGGLTANDVANTRAWNDLRTIIGR